MVRVMQAWIFRIFYVDFLIIPPENAGTLALEFWITLEKVIQLAGKTHNSPKNPFSGMRFSHPRIALCPAWSNNTMVLATQGKKPEKNIFFFLSSSFLFETFLGISIRSIESN